jgi:hypothetical protein
MRGCEHALVRYGLIPEPVLLESHNVMPKNSQSKHDGQRKILVGEEPTCQSGCLVVPDLLIDLSLMGSGICPGVREITCT